MLRRWLRSPAIHLIAGGAVLFVLLRLSTPAQDAVERPLRIELTAADLREISASWVMQGRAAPSDDEMKNLVQERVREEVLYREAIALGLDKRDTVVRQRLAQMMEFLVDDVGSLRAPADDELRAWYASNAARFAVPARATFHQIYFSPDRRGASAHDDASSALGTVAGAPPDSAAATRAGDAFLFERSYDARSSEEIAAQFGPAFAKALLQMPSGAWQGPLQSGYGWHLVWVDALTPPRTPAFDEVAEKVRVAWTDEQQVEMRRRAFASLRGRYEIVLPPEANEDVPAPAREVKQ